MPSGEYGIQAVMSVLFDASQADQALGQWSQKVTAATSKVDKDLDKAEKSFGDLQKSVQRQLAAVNGSLQKTASQATATGNAIKKAQTTAASRPVRPFKSVPLGGTGSSVFVMGSPQRSTPFGSPFITRTPPVRGPILGPMPAPVIPPPAASPVIPPPVATPVLSTAAQNAILRAQEARTTIGVMAEKWKGQTLFRANIADARRKQQQAEAAVRREEKEIEKIIQKTLSAPAALQAAVLNAIKGPQAQAQRRRLMANGATLNQVLATQLTPVVGGAGAGWLAGGRGPTPPQFRGPGGGGRGGGMFGGLLGGAGRFGMGIASGLGIGIGGLGGYAAIQGVQSVIEATELATAYERQTLAASNLAGSQAKLNELLDVYAKASGGAVNETTELANVSRLLATGYAKNAEELERFVRATRGASIALGREQEYIIQETQLAISNVSQKRLDQIGLGITEVIERIEKLRATNKEWSRETAFQEAVLSLMEEKYGALTDSVQGQATGVERLRKSWADLRLEMGRSASGPINQLSGSLAGMFGDMAQRNAWFNQYNRPGAQLAQYASPEEREVFERTQRRRERWEMLNTDFPRAMEDLRNAILGLPAAIRGPDFSSRVPSWMTSVRGGAAPEVGPVGFRRLEVEQQAVIEEAYQAGLDLEKQYNQQRLDEIKNYEQQRASVIRNFGKQMAREEEDFARQRARSLRDYERGILDMLREGREREAEWQEDLDERIGEIREDGNKRLLEIEEKHAEDREAAEEKHRDALMKAAGQLDAIAVLEERKRFRKENEERDKQHKEQVEDAKENMDEQIEDAREAHQERLEDARKADEKRLADMARDRERQLADENEDREIRKNRAIEDHNAQLTEMDRVHGETLAKLQTQAEEEARVLEEALQKDLNALGYYIKGYQNMLLERDKLIDNWFNSIIAKMEYEIAVQQGKIAPYNPLSGSDYIYNNTQSVTPVAPSMTTGVQPNRTNVIELRQGAITIYAADDMNEERVGEIAVEKMIEYLESQ